MSSIADRIKIAQDKDGMLRRALERIIQLYTDRSHFVYELLQNAEDAAATSIKFVQFPDRLEVLHDGKPFTDKNLQGLCDIGKSDKVDNLNQIGEFGVGFKSVFGICDTVRLFSNPSNFRSQDIDDATPFSVEIIDFTSPRDIPAEAVGAPYTTRFVFPYTVGRTFSGFKTLDELNHTLSSKLQNLGITTLLFMKSLELIEYQIHLAGEPVEGQYLLAKKELNDHCSLVSALGIVDTSNANGGNQEEFSYLKFSRSVDKHSNRTVDIAFPVVVTPEGEYVCQKAATPYISVYFPTETESKLNFIVQGPYRTTPNRSSIPADVDENKFLASETAILLRNAIIELRQTNKLNMSFVKVLPLTVKDFDNYALFRPLYDIVRNLFLKAGVIPCRNGGYTSAQYAKIARQEKLAELFSDESLTALIHDGERYRWLPTYLTETNKEYEIVYKYLTGELKVSVIRPEDLRLYFVANPAFLPKQSEDWLVGLYSVFENVGNAFSKTKNETNLLTADIIKTSTGAFVAAYRKTENKQYIPNVFLPSEKVRSTDIHFVDSSLYNRCRHFFDDILQLQQPNEYEFFISDVKKRYSRQHTLNEAQHIDDFRKLYKYLKYDEYREEVFSIISDLFLVKCSDGQMRNAHMRRIFLPVTPDGLQIEEYLKNIAKNVFFVDAEFYENHGITIEMLRAMGVSASLLRYDNVVTGQYYTGLKGKQPEWWTAGDFRWKMTLERVNDALLYISEHPTARDSIIKSKTIFSVLLENETKLCGTVRIGGSTPNKENEPCELLHVLYGDTIRDWNGKWLYTESMELVSPKMASKHDINTAIYGKIKPDSIVYDLLGFKKTESDEVEDLKKTIPQKQLSAFFEDELRRRFGITSTDLVEHFGNIAVQPIEVAPNGVVHNFPAARVKNWEALSKHAAEMLVYADPVRYDYAVRRIRVSNHAKEARAYLRNMYRYDGTYQYACQMCHESCSNIEVVQIFNKPEAELDPMNLCLCPNCATIYRQIRNNSVEMEFVEKQILTLQERAISEMDYVPVMMEGQELWFTQTHIAEIQALLKLKKDVVQNSTKSEKATVDREGDTSGLSVYAAYVGKSITRKDGFKGVITSVNNDYLCVSVLSGSRAGEKTQIKLSFITEHPNVYKIE